MTSEFLIPMATGAGSALAAGISGFQLARRRFGEEKTAYVRLSAEDSDRLEKIEALLERLISLEEQTQEMLRSVAAEMSALRRDQAWQEGYEAGLRHGKLA